MILTDSEPVEYLCVSRGVADVLWRGEAHRLCGTHSRSFQRRGEPRPWWRWPR